ncbi:LamG domain-containing protein, partial [archaeon]|nr:LamG domain-containing protein [archaeon]
PTDGDTIYVDNVYLNATVTDESDTSAFFDWNNSLVGYWSFEEVLTNGTVYDNSSYSNGGVMNNFGSNITVSGKYGNALEFNDTYVQLPDMGLGGSSELTICGWSYLNTLGVGGSDDGMIVAISDDSSYSMFWYDYDDGYSGNDRGYSFTVGNLASDRVNTGDESATVNKWEHVCGVMNGSNRAIYLNGDLKDSKNSVQHTTVPEPTPGKNRIGSWEPSTWYYFNGSLDEIKIFRRALSPEEINASYNNSLHRLYNNFTNLGGGTYNYTAYAIDIGGNLNKTGLRNVTINSAPTTTSSRISPTIAYSNDTLMGFCNGTDVDLDTLAYHWKWYQDGSLIATGSTTGPVVVDDTEDSFEDLSSGAIKSVENSVDENWVTSAAVSGVSKGHLRINYTVPTDTNTAELEYKIFTHAGCVNTNNLSCYNGSSWVLLDSWGNSQNYIKNISIDQLCIDNGEVLELDFYLDCGGGVKEYSRLYEEQVLWTKDAIYYTVEEEVSVHNLSSGNTAKGQNWTLSCMSYDGTYNSSTWYNSTAVEILNTLPGPVSLTSPVNDTSTTSRPPTFYWSDSGLDIDNDALTYHFILDDGYNFDGPENNITGVGSTFHYPTGNLDTDVMYYWKVRANDGVGWGPWSEIWAVTIDSLLDISLTTDLINFSFLSPGETVNTTNPTYPPFVLQNDGNVLSNISINATALFDKVELNTDYYRFKVDNVSGEEISLNWSTSLWNWTNMSNVSTFMIESLNYSDSQDSCEIDILVNVISYEPLGDKESNVTFVASMAE